MLWVTHHRLKRLLPIMCNTKIALKTVLGKVAGLRDRLVIPIVFLPRHKCIWVARGTTLSHVASLKSNNTNNAQDYIQQGCYCQAENSKN